MAIITPCDTWSLIWKRFITPIKEGITNAPHLRFYPRICIHIAISIGICICLDLQHHSHLHQEQLSLFPICEPSRSVGQGHRIRQHSRLSICFHFCRAWLLLKLRQAGLSTPHGCEYKRAVLKFKYIFKIKPSNVYLPNIVNKYQMIYIMSPTTLVLSYQQLPTLRISKMSRWIIKYKIVWSW